MMPVSGRALERGLMIAKPKMACQPERISTSQQIRYRIEFAYTKELGAEREASLQAEIDVGGTDCGAVS